MRASTDSKSVFEWPPLSDHIAQFRLAAGNRDYIFNEIDYLAS
jgi:hypothetical protein